MHDTPKITLVPQPSAIQRLSAFTQQLARLGPTPEFFLSKAFDYALSLPEVYKKHSTAERMEAATALLLELAKLHTEEMREQEKELTTQQEEAPHSQEEEQEEVVATA